MKNLHSLCFLLLTAILLSACGHSQHGLRIYTPTTSTDAKGNTKGGTALLLSANADMPGVKSIKAGEIAIEFDPTVTTTTSKYDAKGQLLASATAPGGLYTSEVTRAQGEADKSRTAAGGDVALKTLFGIALPSLGGDLFGWLGNWLVAP